MIFNKRDRYSYDLLKFEEKDIEALRGAITTILHPDSKQDSIITLEFWRSCIINYIGSYVTTRELTYNSLDSSLVIYVPLEIIKEINNGFKRGLIVFVSKLENTIKSEVTDYKYTYGGYEEDVILSSSGK